MSDLISRAAMLDDMQKELEKAVNIEDMTDFECKVIMTSAIALKSFVNRQPTVEAVPVVHGEWLDNGEKDVYGISKPFAISCSICGSSAGTSWMNFCPNCGSDMRKKVQE